jgi:hypothetical protein
MPDAIIDGTGSGYPVAVTSDNKLKVDASVTAGSESVITAGSVEVFQKTDNELKVQNTAGSIQTYTQLGSVEVWQTTNSDMQVQATQEGTWDINNITTGSVRVVSQNQWTGIGSVRIAEQGPVLEVKNSPIVIDGSILVTTANRIGSKLLPSLNNEIKWISVSGTNAGSTFGFGIKDAEGFLIQRILRQTGEYSYLSPIQASGGIVFTVSGTQASGTYPFRVAYV